MLVKRGFTVYIKYVLLNYVVVTIGRYFSFGISSLNFFSTFARIQGLDMIQLFIVFVIDYFVLSISQLV